MPPAAQLGCQHQEGGDGGWNGQPKPTPAATLPQVPKTPVYPPPPPVCPYAALQAATPSSTPTKHTGPSQVSGRGTHRDSRGSSVVLNRPRTSCTQLATAEAPEASAWFVSGVRRGCCALRPNGGPPAALSKPSQSIVGARRGYRALWATERTPAAQFGPLGWWRKGKEPLTTPGWAEPRTMVRPPGSVNHPGHHTGAHAACNHQGVRHTHARPTEWWGACAPCAGQHGGEAHGGPPGRRMEGWKCWAACTRKCGKGCGG